MVGLLDRFLYFHVSLATYGCCHSCFTVNMYLLLKYQNPEILNVKQLYPKGILYVKIKKMPSDKNSLILIILKLWKGRGRQTISKIEIKYFFCCETQLFWFSYAFFGGIDKTPWRASLNFVFIIFIILNITLQKQLKKHQVRHCFISKILYF